jgi:hypothetical protein
VRIVVTKVAEDGSIRRGILDTVGRSDAGKCEELLRRADLAVPSPYRPARDKAVYQIRDGKEVVFVAEGQLTGPLRFMRMAAARRAPCGA